MSWMDSWSRPSKSQATPPPYYLLPGGDKTPYCKACGRVIGDRKTKNASAATPAKYCSSRCKNARHDKALDYQIENTFAALLNCQPPPIAGEVLPLINVTSNERDKASGSSKKKQKKGESRILVGCGEVEKAVFGEQDDPDKKFGRRKNRARRGMKDDEVWKSVDMVSDDDDEEPGPQQNEMENSQVSAGPSINTSRTDELTAKRTLEYRVKHTSDNESDDSNNGGVSIKSHIPTTDESGTKLDSEMVAQLSIRSGTRIRPPQELSEVNGGVGGEKGVKERISESEDMLAKRRVGQKKADQKELVKCAARRAVAFGLVVAKRGEKGEERRLCEAVMQGSVVESSFAKGEWGIRWRE